MEGGSDILNAPSIATICSLPELAKQPIRIGIGRIGPKFDPVPHIIIGLTTKPSELIHVVIQSPK